MSMSMSRTKAAINLFAVLRNLEDLCRVDEQASALIRGRRESVHFKMKNGPAASLIFSDGTCTMTDTGENASVKLYFRSTEHFNRMIDGQGKPIPLKGFTRLGFLTGPFTGLTKRLEYYLQPEPERLKNPDYFRLHTMLLLNTAARAVACIGNYDPVGKLIAQRIPDGVISLSVLESGQEIFLQAKQGLLKAMSQTPEPPRSFMVFDTIRSAHDALAEQADVHELIVKEKIRLKGLLPMIQHMNDLLPRVSLFLK